ncbi:MAG: DNA repair protein RecN [Alphaproteobacteria bacterium]|nr:DNA repair protein RecN [Alphaproteobacteria bacterium]MBP7729248.1 DNA repair protein RecN [Alphaproteobacteria bacterium]
MLQALSIRNVILIDDLHIDFAEGLCVLTGETGAGKSILLDALGFALGDRAEARLLKSGTTKAAVTATFLLSPLHALWQQLEDQGIAYAPGEIIFRRILDANGKSKCFINDQMVSQTLMRRLGQDLVEIHGQFDQLFHPKSQLIALDTYEKIEKKSVQEAFKRLQEAKKILQTFEENLNKSFERQVFLRFAIEEIEKIKPQAGEEDRLEAERSLIAHRAKIAEALLNADQNLATIVSGLSQTHKALDRVKDLLPEKINPLLEGSDRAIVEVQEVLEGMNSLRTEVEGTPRTLETLENRLYALSSLTRKYQTENLVSCLIEFKNEFTTLEQGENHLESLKAAVTAAKNEYIERARTLSEKRKQVALKLQEAVAMEFPPLKLEHAKFRIHFEDLIEDAWGVSGMDRVEFYIQTNPGTPEGSLSAIASGGELSRLMLALKVVLVKSGAVPTLIFDEIESGTGGAVAAAIGERLKTLAQNIQILAITHSPQIASYGNQHLVVVKTVKNEATATHVIALQSEEKHEEIARMLAGEEITAEARAAAKRLIEGSDEYEQNSSQKII